MAVATNGATGNGVEHEQEIAMRQAHALLAKHNLSMVDVIDVKEDRDEVVIDEEFPCPFRRVIAIAVANLFFCKFYWSKVPNKQKYKFCFIGLESNAETAKYMTIFLIKSLSVESERQRKANQESVGWGTTFRNAAASRIANRCSAIRAEAERASKDAQAQTASDCRALSIVSLYESEEKANANFIDQILGLKLRTKKLGGKLMDRDAAIKGDSYGRNVSLSQQIVSSKQKSAGLIA